MMERIICQQGMYKAGPSDEYGRQIVCGAPVNKTDPVVDVCPECGRIDGKHTSVDCAGRPSIKSKLKGVFCENMHLQPFV